MGRLDGKVALISGAARGQGAAEARLFAREGAKVVIVDLRDEEGKKVEAEIRESGGEATFVHMDVTSGADWRRTIEATVQKYGKLNILVNNAAIDTPGRKIEDCSEEEWDEVMAVNAKGVFLGTQNAIPEMRRAGGGSIVNISSLAALPQGRDQEAAYTASKAAVHMFSRVTANQHAVDNIRCNTVFPGPIDTPMMREALPSPEILAERLTRVPLGRLGKPEDIAYGVLYLASDEASYVSGTELVIGGGE